MPDTAAIVCSSVKLPADAPPYEGQLAESDRLAILARVGDEALVGLTQPPDMPTLFESMARAPVDPPKVALLNRAWPLALSFVRSELDYATPGERGIGRSSLSPPRLAGAFRDELSRAEVRGEFGRLSEQAVTRGWGAHAATQLILSDGPFELRERALGAIWEEWIPGIYAATRNAGSGASAIFDAVLEPLHARWQEAAREYGLVRGMRRGKARERLAQILWFHFNAGIGLMAHNTSQADREHARRS